jgi:cell division protein FtsB
MIPLELVQRFWKPVLGAVLVLFGALGAHSCYREKQTIQRLAAAEKAHQEALEEAALGKEARAQLPIIQAERDDLKAKRKDLEAQIGDLEAELGRRPFPPGVGPVPTELAQVLTDLKGMGIHPEPLSTAQFGLPNGDAPVVWTWGKESLRVPGLESRLETTTNLKEKLKLDVDNLTLDLAAADRQKAAALSSSLHFENAFGKETTRANGLMVELKTTADERDSARRTRIYVGIGSAVVGGYFTYKVIKK